MIQGMTTPLGYLAVEVSGGPPDYLQPMQIEARLGGKPVSRERAQEIIAGMQDGTLQRELRGAGRRQQEIDRLILEARARFGLDAGDLIAKAYDLGSSSRVPVPSGMESLFEDYDGRGVRP